jgi:putative transposase
MRSFNELAGTWKTGNRLPHWQQDGATYFVTYRLAESIPCGLIERWRKDRQLWLESNPKPWAAETESEYHRRFSREFDHMMDRSLGSCILRNSGIRDLLAGTFEMFEGERYLLHSWVVMPNNVHLLLTMAEGKGLEKAVTSWKNYTERKINELSRGCGAIWQRDYFDWIIRDWDHFANVARYIRRSPVKAKLAAGEYSFFEDDMGRRILG